MGSHPRNIPNDDYSKANQEHNDGNLIDTMHYFNVEVGRSVRVFLSEEIT